MNLLLQSITNLAKELVKVVLIPAVGLLAFILRVAGFRLAYVDTTKLGHFFCDTHLFCCFLSEGKCRFKYIISITNNSIKNLNYYLPENCRPIPSLFLSYISGWYRNYPFIVENFTNSHTQINDKFMGSEFYRPSQYSKLIQLYNSQPLLNKINKQKKLNIDGGYWVFHFRQPSLFNLDGEMNQKFRNSNIDVAEVIIKEIVKRGTQVVNLSEREIAIEGVINVRAEATFNASSLIEYIGRADVYIGDASGPTVVAQMFNKPSLLFNIFPHSFFPKNPKSIVHYKIIKSNGRVIPFHEKFFKQINGLTLGQELIDLNVELGALNKINARKLISEYYLLLERQNYKKTRQTQRYYSHNGMERQFGKLSEQNRNWDDF